MDIENILIAKRDLDTYSTKNLDTLAKYYNAGSKNRNDLCWLLSMAILGESHKATMRGSESGWDVIEANVFDYDQVLDLIEAIVQLEQQRVDYTLETLNQDPILEGVEIYYIYEEDDDNYKLAVMNRDDDHSWRFVAEFVIKTDKLPEKFDPENLLDLLPIMRDAEVESVDSRNVVGGGSGLKGGNTVILKTAQAFTKSARKQG